jgi:glycosyltransferase involved in cell wall biosynthesis
MKASDLRVWLDAEGSQRDFDYEPGLARYVAEQASALWKAAPEAVQAIALSPELPRPGSLDPLLGSGPLHWKGPTPPSPLPSLYHVMSPFDQGGAEGDELVPLQRIWPSWARQRPVRTVVSLHDLTPLVLRDHYLEPNARFAAAYLARLDLLRTADQVLAASEATAADAVELIGMDESRITVVGTGAPLQTSSLVGSATGGRELLRLSIPEVREGFLLYAGGDEYCKNQDGMIDAYGRLSRSTRAKHQLVIASKLNPKRAVEIQAQAGRLGIDSADLLMIGDVEDHFRAALYRSCALFVFPSLYEGAALPLLEAMSCGAPVAASRAGSLPEILGDERATFDPSDAVEIAECVERTLADSDQLDALRESSMRRAELHSWQRVAERTLDGYERALSAGGRPTPKRERRRLAVFTPWPPEPSGVATHSRRLVEELLAYADVDVIVADEGGGEDYDRSLAPAVELHPAAHFERLREVRGYDRILYALGNSHFHVHAYKALMSSPGMVLVHDVRLTQLYGAVDSAMNSSASGWMREKLREMYGDRVPREELDRIPNLVTENKYSIMMTREIQARAEGILVHSRHAVESLKMDCEVGTLPARAEIVSHGIPNPLSQAKGAPSRDAPVVLSCGHFGLVKGLDAMVHAFALLVSERPGARLRLVGHLGDYDREYMHTLASRLGIADSVELHGRVDDGDYWRLLSSADVAVQLRFWSNGEASGAVADCLAARIPTIVSDIGWFKELPAGVALRVPQYCPADRLAEEMARAIDDKDLRAEMRAAQDEYVAAHSFAEVAKRYAQLLAL